MRPCRALAAYEIYGRVLLVLEPSGLSWQPGRDDVVDSLRAELARLQLQLQPPTARELRAELTTNTVARLRRAFQLG